MEMTVMIMPRVKQLGKVIVLLDYLQKVKPNYDIL